MQTSAEVLLPYLIGPYSGLVILVVVVVVQYRMNKEERLRTDRAVALTDTVTGYFRDILSRLERQEREEEIRREYERGGAKDTPGGTPGEAP